MIGNFWIRRRMEPLWSTRSRVRGERREDARAVRGEIVLRASAVIHLAFGSLVMVDRYKGEHKVRLEAYYTSVSS